MGGFDSHILPPKQGPPDGGFCFGGFVHCLRNKLCIALCSGIHSLYPQSKGRVVLDTVQVIRNRILRLCEQRNIIPQTPLAVRARRPGLCPPAPSPPQCRQASACRECGTAPPMPVFGHTSRPQNPGCNFPP